MGRKCFDCRCFPAGIKCSMVMSADTDEELLEVVVQHHKAVHGDKDTAEFREMIRNEIVECSELG